MFKGKKGDTWLRLKDKLNAKEDDTFVRRTRIDVVELKEWKEGYTRVHLYLEHGQEIEGWVKDTTV